MIGHPDLDCPKVTGRRCPDYLVDLVTQQEWYDALGLGDDELTEGQPGFEIPPAVLA